VAYCAGAEEDDVSACYGVAREVYYFPHRREHGRRIIVGVKRSAEYIVDDKSLS